VLFEEPRQLSAYAVGPTLLFAVPTSEFLSVLQRCPAMRFALIKELKSNRKLFRSLDSFVNYTTNAISSAAGGSGILECAPSPVSRRFRRLRSPFV
jgi:CRP-like cAMP-binding protein